MLNEDELATLELIKAEMVLRLSKLLLSGNEGDENSFHLSYKQVLRVSSRTAETYVTALRAEFEAVEIQDAAPQKTTHVGWTVEALLAKLSQPVSVLEPSVRSDNCFAAAGIETLADLVRLTEADTQRIKNFGRTSLKEIKHKLAQLGLSFGMEIPARTGVLNAK